jgi:AcrR family transcriptional regulator
MDHPVAIEPASDKGAKRAEELLTSLEEILLNEGFARLTVGDMAARLRCSRRTIYELAPSKHELVLLVLERFFAGIRDTAQLRTAQGGDPGVLIYEYLQPGVRAAERMKPAMVTDIDRWVPSRRLWQSHIRLRVEGLRRLVELGVESGAFKQVHAHLVAEMVFATISRLREPDFYRNTNMTMSDAFREFYALLIDALVRKRD